MLLHYTEGYWLFLDWTNIDSSGICATFNMWYVHALKAMQRVCKVLKQDGSKYAAQEKAVTKAMTKMFYDKKNGVWWESMNLSKGLISQRSQHANALAYLAGLPIGKGSRRELMRPSHLKSKIEHPLASAYFSNYIYESLFGLGEGRTALKNMKAGFGVMLDAGATTLWEHWGNANNYGSWSVCHAWSAHPLQHLTRQVLGLKAAGPKWSKFTFDPWKYGGITWARGKVPTPYGEICAEWEMKNGKISGKTEGPKETLKIQL